MTYKELTSIKINNLSIIFNHWNIKNPTAPLPKSNTNNKLKTYLACSSGSFLCRCIWNIRSPPFTYSMTKNNLNTGEHTWNQHPKQGSVILHFEDWRHQSKQRTRSIWFTLNKNLRNLVETKGTWSRKLFNHRRYKKVKQHNNSAICYF